MIPTERIQKFKDLTFSKENTSDKEIEETIWEEISIPLSQVDIDNQSDGYIQYLNAVHWAKWGRDNFSGVRFAESELNTDVESAYNRGLSDGQTITESAIKQIAMEFSEWRDFNSWKSDYIEQKTIPPPNYSPNSRQKGAKSERNDGTFT